MSLIAFYSYIFSGKNSSGMIARRWWWFKIAAEKAAGQALKYGC
jgi:hypothetical protein